MKFVFSHFALLWTFLVWKTHFKSTQLGILCIWMYEIQWKHLDWHTLLVRFWKFNLIWAESTIILLTTQKQPIDSFLNTLHLIKICKLFSRIFVYCSVFENLCFEYKQSKYFTLKFIHHKACRILLIQ